MPAIRWPNARNNPDGAIPVFLSSDPKAIPIQVFSGPAGPNFGPIPVRIVAGAGTPPFGNDQSNDNNAIPVYESTAANAMPVWEAVAAAPTPPIITTLSFTNGMPSGDIDVIGQMRATNASSAPGTWAIIENTTPLTLLLQATNGQFVITNGLSIVAGTYEVVISATNADGTDTQTIEIIYTEP
jgi:hypothetical protein